MIGGRHTATGRPILASDSHVGLESPALLSPIELDGGGFDIQGDRVPGEPSVILGQNRDAAFGAPQHFVGVTDAFVDQLGAAAIT